MVQRSAGKAKSGRASTIEPSEIQPPLILLYTALWALFRSVGLVSSIMPKVILSGEAIDQRSAENGEGGWATVTEPNEIPNHLQNIEIRHPYTKEEKRSLSLQNLLAALLYCKMKCLFLLASYLFKHSVVYVIHVYLLHAIGYLSAVIHLCTARQGKR